MNYIRYAVIMSFLMMPQIGATEITQQQQTIYPQNPHLVEKAGVDFNSPEDRELFINSMQQASSFCRTAAWGCGIATLGCLAVVVCAEGTKKRVGSLVASLFLGGTAFLLGLVSKVQAQMAANQEIVVVDNQATTASSTTLADVSDGIHIFSSANCPPCKLLHDQAIPQIRQILPTLAIFEYEVNGNAETTAVIQKMSINVCSTPLTVVVKGGTIVRIISGYSKSDAFLQKINEALA